MTLKAKVKRSLTLALSLGFLVLPGSAKDDDNDLDGLGARWWQWAISIPTSANPVADTNGGNCMVGQNASIWFLAGNFGGTTTRNCSVPGYKSLFFPVINSLGFDSPNVCGQQGSLSVKEMRAYNAAFVNGAINLSVKLDGKPIHNFHRLRSDV